MDAKMIYALMLFALLGLSFSATVGVGETILVSNSDLGTDDAPPESGTDAGSPPNEGKGANGTGDTPPNSGSVVVSVGETADSSGNMGGQAPANGSVPAQAGAGNASPSAPVRETSRERFMITTASGQQVSAGEISAVQARPGMIEVMAQEGNAFVSAEEEGQGAAEVDAEVSSSSGEQLRLRIHAMEQEMLMQMGNTSVSTAETLRIRERLVYIERNGTEYRVNVLPSDLPVQAREASSLENITLELSGEGPAYRFTLRERRNFLGLFGVDSESMLTLNAQNGQITGEEGPWWGFMAPPEDDLRPALNELPLRIASGQN